MHLCYLDESGTPEIPGTTSHYVLAGLSIPIEEWKNCENSISSVKAKFGLENQEIHTGWILRPFPDQKPVKNFIALTPSLRRNEVMKVRTGTLLALQKDPSKREKYKQLEKTYRKTEPYIHLTRQERDQFVAEIAKVISKWTFARLFAECIDKVHCSGRTSTKTIDEQAFEQVVSRFQSFLGATGPIESPNLGIMIHDNNQTVAKKHTDLMKSFHKSGTLWRKVTNIIETPLFVDSSLTSMIQIADLCSYALRRYCENGERDLFEHIYKRADKRNGIVVGIRHYTDLKCGCKICVNHKASTGSLFPMVGEP